MDPRGTLRVISTSSEKPTCTLTGCFLLDLIRDTGLLSGPMTSTCVNKID